MSQENVSIVRRLYELMPNLLESGPEALDGDVGDYDDRFEIHLPSDYPEGEQVLRGSEGMNAMAAMLQEAWSEWRFVPERCR
jgi:hypothetical protein